MRRLIKYEFQKLLSPLMIITTALLLLLNSFLLYTDSTEAMKKNGGLDVAALESIYDQYFNDPDAIISYYDELVAFEKAQNDAMIEAYKNGQEYVGQTLEGKYIKADYRQDIKLIERVMADADEVRDYPSDMNTVIRNTYINRAAYLERGYTEQSWYYRNQVRNAEIYTSVRDSVVMGFEYVHGWGTLLESSYSSIFIFFIMLLVSASIFTKESVSGMLPIMHTTRRGRLTTAMSKLTVIFSCATLLVLLFGGASYLTVGFTEGFSNSYNALHVLDRFRFAPYAITLGEYFILSELLCLLSVCIFSLIVGMISILFYNYVLTYAAGMAMLGLNLVVFTADPEKAGLVSYLNLVSLSDATRLYERLRTVNFFGAVCGYLDLALLICGVLAITLPLLCVLLWCRRKTGIHLGFIKKPIAALRRLVVGVQSVKTKRLRPCPMPLIFAELYKMLVSSRLWIVVVILLVARFALFTANIDDLKGPNEYVYRNYMLRFEGLVTEQKVAEVQAELDRINEIIAQKEDMDRDYAEGTVLPDDYFNYLSSYNNAMDDRDVVEDILSDAKRKLAKNQKNGTQLWLVYDTGWHKLFGLDADYFCYAIILLLSVGIFAGEYNERSSSFGFAQILRTCRRGRAVTFWSKLLGIVGISSILTLLCSTLDTLLVKKSYKIPAAIAPLGSLSEFSGAGGLSIGAYLAYYITVRILACILLGLLAVALSQLTRRVLTTGTIAVGVTLIPTMLIAFGVKNARFFSFTHVMQVSELFVDGIRKQLFSFDGGLIMTIGGAFVIVVIACLTVCALNWCGLKRSS